MRFVKNQQAEPVAKPFNMAGGGIISGDGQRLRFVITAADQANLLIRKRRPQQRIPLVH